MKGKLYLIPTHLNPQNPDKSIVPYLKEVIKEVKEFIVEDEKSARKFIKSLQINTQFGQLILHPYNKHHIYPHLQEYLKPLFEGRDMGLLSEAGCPAVADPGSEIVRLAHEKEITVVPLVGPSSIIMALMASGFNGQQFCFQGYLPIPAPEKIRKLQEMEKASFKLKQTQIFIETPFRNNQLLDEIFRSCQPSTELCIACDITGDEEFIYTQSISKWKKNRPELHKKPAIFLLYKRS